MVSDLKSVGMKLQTKPRAPTRHELAVKAGRMLPRKVHPTWQPFLSAVWKEDDSNTPTTAGGLDAAGINIQDGKVQQEPPNQLKTKKMSKNKKKKVKKKQREKALQESRR